MSKKLYIGNIELATAADLQAVEARVLKLLPDVASEAENQLVVTSVSGLKAVDPVEFLSESLSAALTQFATKEDLNKALSWDDFKA